MAKQEQQTDEGLFGGIDMDAFEDGLITVGEEGGDSSEDSAVVIEDPPGTGESDNQDPPKPEDKEKKKIETGEEDMIVVDTDEDDDDEKAKTTDKAREQEDSAATKTEEKDESKKGGTSDRDENESPVYLHAAALQEEGVLPDFDLDTLKDKDPGEAILEINKHIQSQIETSIKEGLDEYKNGLGQKAQEFIESLEKGVPFEELADNYTLEQRFSGIDEKTLQDNEELQEAVYRDYLAIKGFSDSRIERLVTSAKEKDQLLDESKDSLGEIDQMILDERKQAEKDAEARKKEAEKRRNETTEKIKTTINSVKEILPGMEVSEAEKKKLLKDLTVPVGYEKLPDGRKRPLSRSMEVRKKDPIAFEMRLNYLIDKGFFDDNPKNKNLQTFMKQSESSAAKKLAERLKSDDKKNHRITTGVEGKTNKDEDNFVFPQDIMNQ